MKSKVVVQVADRRLVCDEREVPPVGPEEGLLRVEGCGLCGSDVEQYRGGFVAKGIMRYPLIPGHEPVGVIEEIGREASRRWNVKTGDRVALEPHISCGYCSTCLRGSYHLCRKAFAVATPTYGYLSLDIGHGLWGGYSEYIHLHPRTIVHKLPHNLPLALATMYQALAAGVRWAVQVPKTALGDTVVILGCGQRGLGSVIACKEAGVGRIIVTGLQRDRFKLDLALALGAHHAIVADAEDTVARIQEITGGRGADVVLDVVPVDGHPVIQAIEIARMGATIVLAGVKGHSTTVAIDTDKLISKELTLQGVYAQGASAYEESLRILSENKYDLDRLHTHQFPLEKAEQAILTLAGERQGENAICVSLHPA